MSRVARNLTIGSSLRVLTQLVAAGAAFVLMPYFVHSVGDRDYGLWSVVGSFGMYWALLDFGFGTAIIRHLSRALGAGDKEQCQRLFAASLVVFSGAAGLILLAGGAALFLAPLFCRTPEEVAVFRSLVPVCALNMALLVWFRAFIAALNADLRYDCTAALDLLTVLMRSATMVYAVASGFGVLGMAWGSTLGALPSMLLSVWVARRKLPFARFRRARIRMAEVRSLASYSVFALMGQAADIFRFQLDAPLVGWLFGAAAVTHYRLAGTLASYALDTVASAIGVFQPLFSRQEGRHDPEAIRRTYFFATKLSLSVATFVGFGLIAWGKPFLLRWMGPRYLDAYPCLVLLAVACTMTLWQVPSVNLLYGISRHRWYAAFNWVEGLSNLALSIFFARRFGLVGVAMGTVIPVFVMRLVVQPLYTCSVAGIRYGDYLRHAGRALGAALAALVLPLVVTLYFAAPAYPSLVLVGAVSALCYAVLQWSLAFTAGERAMLLSAMRRGRGAASAAGGAA